MNSSSFQKINIVGIPIANVTLASIKKVLEQLLESPGIKTIFAANPHSLYQATINPELMDAMKSATLVYPDGVGVVIVSRIIRSRLRETTKLYDFLPDIFLLAKEKGLSLYVLGGEEDVVKKAIQNVKKKYRGLKIAGYQGGYFSMADEKKIIVDIHSKHPDIVLIAMGTPKQELWIMRNKDKIGAKLFFGIGASIDILAGRFNRAPIWMRKSEIEWLYRFILEPKRLWRRYFLETGIIFIKAIFPTGSKRL